MKKTSCLTIAQINSLEENFKLKKGTLGILEGIEDVSKVNERLSLITSLQQNNKANIESIIASVGELLAKNDKTFIRLKTGLKEGKDTEKGFSSFDLDDYTEMFNSAFISLYNVDKLFNLLKTEKGIAGTYNKSFKNKGLQDAIETFLKTGENFVILEDIKKVYERESFPFDNIDDNADTKLFYIENVIPFMLDFIQTFNRMHFKPNVFEPALEKVTKNYPMVSVGELTFLDANFNTISKNKDIMTGAGILYADLAKKLGTLDDDASQDERIAIIDSHDFYKLAKKILQSFKFNDQSFSGLTEREDSDEDENIKKATGEITTRALEFQGNEKSGYESSSTETRSVLASLFDIDTTIKTDFYGMPLFLNPFSAFKNLNGILKGAIDYSEFYEILKKEQKAFPFISQLLDGILVDPSKPINSFFVNEKGAQRKWKARLRSQRIKQALMQDLTKDEVVPKELDLKVILKKNRNTEKTEETITVDVNNAKKNKTSSIENDASTRFYQKYFKNKTKVFGEPLTNSEGFIRLEVLIEASKLFTEMTTGSKKDFKNQPMSEVFELLGTLGIVPSLQTSGKSESLKNLIKHNQKSIKAFFSTLPSGESSYFLKAVKVIKNKKLGVVTTLFKKDILKTITSFTEKKATYENLEELREALKNKETTSYKNLIQQLNVKTVMSKHDYELGAVEQLNDELFYIVDDYIDNIYDLYTTDDEANITKHEEAINNLTDLFLTEVDDKYQKVLREMLESEVTNKNKLRALLELNNPVKQLLDLQPLYSEYYELEAKHNTEYDDKMFIDHNGKKRSTVQYLNNLLIKARDLSSHKEKLLTRFPELDPRKNPLVASSIILKQLYTLAPDGSLKPNKQSKTKISINNVLGMTLKGKNVNSGGLSVNELDLGDGLLSSVLMMLFDGNEESLNGDRAAAYNIRFSEFERSKFIEHFKEQKVLTDKFLPVPVSLVSKLFVSKSIETDAEANTKKVRKYINYSGNIANAMTPIAGIFRNYLAHYLLQYYEIEKGNMQYVKKDYSYMGKNYGELGMFHKDSSKSPEEFIISIELKNLYKAKVLELDLKEMDLSQKINEINNIIESSVFGEDVDNGYSKFKKDLFNYFRFQVDKTYDNIPYTSDTAELGRLVDVFKNKTALPYYSVLTNVPEIGKTTDSKNIKKKTIDYASFLKSVLMTYTINYEILSQEKMLLFYGDPAFLKPSTYVKRVNSPTSTGSYALLDDWDIDMYNHPDNKEAFAYAKKLNDSLPASEKFDMNIHKVGYSYRFGEVDDLDFKSKAIEKLEKGFKESYRLKYKTAISEEELDKKAKRALSAYYALNEADGFGVITFDWYRIFSQQTNTWSEEQEALYLDLINGKPVSEALARVTFPVRKFSYVGSIFKDKNNLPADGFHKFSLSPLIPGIEDSNLQTKHDNLVKEGKAYEIFNSASKKERIKTKNKKNKFYDGEQGDRVLKPLTPIKDKSGKVHYDSGNETLYAMFQLFKDQVHIDTHVKNKSILPRQLKRIIKTDYYYRGVPFDYQDTVENWKNLTEKEKREQSSIHDTYRGIADNISKINRYEEKQILEKFGLEQVKVDKKLKYQFKKGVAGEHSGKREFIKTLKNELIRKNKQQKDGGGNVYIKLLSGAMENEDTQIEAFINSRDLKNIVKNIIDSNTRLRKFNGSNLIQSPVTGMEPKVTFEKDAISTDSTGYLKTYQFSKGGTIFAEVMTTLTKEWEHLLYLTHNGSIIENIDNLNKALKDTEWRELHKDKISMLAVRVPIQDPNSIEGFTIKQFLPMTYGAKIVVPSEIVAKSGSDFDIDKLMVYFFNYNLEQDTILYDDSMEGLENQIIKGYMDLLARPEMFHKLITSNNILVLKKDPEKVDNPDNDRIVDVLEKRKGQSVTKYDESDLRNPFFNINQKTILQTAKRLLGHAATIRSNFEELKHAGLLMSESFKFKIGVYLTNYDKSIIKNESIKATANKPKDSEARLRFPFQKGGQPVYNVTEAGNISLGDIFNKSGELISEIISALINGFVDVGSSPWIVIFNMSAELTSLNFLYLIAGVPQDYVFMSNNQQIVQDFIYNKLALKRSLFKRLFNQNRSQNNTRLLTDTFFKVISELGFKESGILRLSEEKIELLQDTFRLLNIDNEHVTNYINSFRKDDSLKERKEEYRVLFNAHLEQILFEIFNTTHDENLLTIEDLHEGLGLTYKNMNAQQLANQIKLLAFTVFMKPYAEGNTRALQAIDYDKSQSQHLHEEYKNKSNIKLIKKRKYYTPESFSDLERYNVAAPYDMGDFITEIFSLVWPLTDNKIINNYALKLTKQLNFEKFINNERSDTVTSTFKMDFMNFIVQNYGEMEKTGENIVEYAIKNSIFVDKTIELPSGKQVTSNNIADKSVANKLFIILDTFNKFESLGVFQYLIPLNGKKIQDENNEENTDLVFRIGKIFKNLSPVELDEFNKDMQIFKNTTIKTRDVLLAIEKQGAEVMSKYVMNPEISFEEVVKELNNLKKESGLGSITTIDITALSDETRKVLFEFKDVANKTKKFTVEMLPYLSLLQSTASYSNTYFSNLFVKKNNQIMEQAVDNFMKQEPEGVTKYILNDFVVQFLLNNKRLLRTDKQIPFYKMLVGVQDTRYVDMTPEEAELERLKLKNSFKSSKLLNTANYFNNYYRKEFSIMNTITNFKTARTVSEVITHEGDPDSFIFKFISETVSKDEFDIDNTYIDEAEFDEADPSEDEEQTGVAYEDEEQIAEEDNESEAPIDPVEEVTEIHEVQVRGVTYNVDPITNKVTEKGKAVRDNPSLIHEILVNYYSSIGKLKISSMGNNSYFLAGNKVIQLIQGKEGSPDIFKNVSVNGRQIEELKQKMIPYTYVCKI